MSSVHLRTWSRLASTRVNKFNRIYNLYGAWLLKLYKFDRNCSILLYIKSTMRAMVWVGCQTVFDIAQCFHERQLSWVDASNHECCRLCRVDLCRTRRVVVTHTGNTMFRYTLENHVELLIQEARMTLLNRCLLCHLHAVYTQHVVIFRGSLTRCTMNVHLSRPSDIRADDVMTRWESGSA